MNNETKTSELENSANDSAVKPQDDEAGEAEFKVTVRKLEMPVRPRGVLAE